MVALVGDFWDLHLIYSELFRGKNWEDLCGIGKNRQEEVEYVQHSLWKSEEIGEIEQA